MTHFDDLTPHTYSRRVGPETVLNVGWLGAGHSFPQGDCDPEFVACLEQLVVRPIILHRGFHVCDLCPPKKGQKRACGNGQIRVRGASPIWFAAPTLIHHYVTQHRYLPPSDFIEAVIAPHEVAIEAQRIQYWPK